MSEHCYSTLICAERDKCIFEKMGYTAECSQALTIDGNEIPSSIVMVDREAANGHYEELTALIGTPFLACNGARHGVYGDHLLASDGKDWCSVEALHESSYPAVRVDPSGVIAWSEVEEGRKYWVCTQLPSPQLIQPGSGMWSVLRTKGHFRTRIPLCLLPSKICRSVSLPAYRPGCADRRLVYWK